MKTIAQTFIVMLASLSMLSCPSNAPFFTIHVSNTSDAKNVTQVSVFDIVPNQGNVGTGNLLSEPLVPGQWTTIDVPVADAMGADFYSISSLEGNQSVTSSVSLNGPVSEGMYLSFRVTNSGGFDPLVYRP